MKKIFSILLFFLLMTFFSNAQPHSSYPYLTTSNGMIVAVYNSEKNRIENVFPHIFANYDSGTFVHPFIGNLQLQVDERPVSVSYWNNTHIIQCVYKKFSVYYFAPFTSGEKIFYAAIKGKRKDVGSLTFHYESGAGKIQSDVTHLCNALEDLPVKFSGDLIMGSFTRSCGEDCIEKYFLFSFTDSLHHDKNIVTNAIKKYSASSVSLLNTEYKWMRNVIGHCHYPAGLNADEKNVAEQSVSILKMSQVSDKEIFPQGRGQILASLRPGLWHTSWVRDGSYAIQAMTKLGLYTEAKKGLEFQLKAKSDLFKHYFFNGKDYGPGVDYQISLTRFFGNGKEECDYNEYGPNIEYDDWGLFLTAFTIM